MSSLRILVDWELIITCQESVSLAASSQKLPLGSSSRCALHCDWDIYEVDAKLGRATYLLRCPLEGPLAAGPAQRVDQLGDFLEVLHHQKASSDAVQSSQGWFGSSVFKGRLCNTPKGASLQDTAEITARFTSSSFLSWGSITWKTHVHDPAVDLEEAQGLD